MSKLTNRAQGLQRAASSIRLYTIVDLQKKRVLWWPNDLVAKQSCYRKLAYHNSRGISLELAGRYKRQILFTQQRLEFNNAKKTSKTTIHKPVLALGSAILSTLLVTMLIQLVVYSKYDLCQNYGMF